MYSLTQAAKRAGVAKSTVTRAIKTGRLSATRNDDGTYGIDPSELHRVFPAPVAAEPPEVALRNLLAQVSSERDDLRRRLDDSEAERRAVSDRLTRLLTHDAPPAGPGWGGWVLGVALVVALALAGLFLGYL